MADISSALGRAHASLLSLQWLEEGCARYAHSMDIILHNATAELQQMSAPFPDEALDPTIPSCSLSLQLDSFQDNGRGFYADSFHAFLPEVNRWREMRIYLSANLCKLFLAVAPGKVTCLEELSLNTHDWTDEQAEQLPTILNQFTRLPKLQFTRGLGTPLLGLQFTSLNHLQHHTPLSLD